MLIVPYPPLLAWPSTWQAALRRHVLKLALSVPSSSRAPSQPPDGRDLDWKDYKYQQDPAAGGGQQGDLENSLAALLAEIPDFNTAELEALLPNLPVPDDTRQPVGMTMAEAMELMTRCNI